MDQQSTSNSAGDITKFIEYMQSTQDLHFLACRALQKWADSLADGIPSGYERFKVWLEICGDLGGKTPAQDVPKLPVMAKVREKTVVSQLPPLFLKVASTTTDALSAVSSSDVPPPHLRKRKTSPNELSVSPSIHKTNMRLSSVESCENLADRPAGNETATASPVVIANPVSSFSDIWNVPSKKARVEDIDAIFSSCLAAYSEPESECEPTAASSADAPGSGVSTGGNGKCLCWTAELDDRLSEAVRLHGEDGWECVAKHFGTEATVKQCRKRYNRILQYLEQGLVRNETWSEVEISLLEQLVPKHTVDSYYSHRRKAMTQKHIDWASIGRELNRVPRSCARKWKKLQAALSNKTVAEGGTELVSSEYAATARPSTSSPCSSSGDGESSSAGSDRSSSQSSTLSKVGPVSASDSELGGLGVGGSTTVSNATQVLWTDEEIERLLELVKLHVIPPHWNKTHKVMTQEYIEWTRIAKVLNKPPLRCRDKWRSLKAAKLMGGHFTEDEDILIECFVREWGNKGKGLWVRLEKDLGRNSMAIRQRWFALQERTATVPVVCQK